MDAAFVTTWTVPFRGREAQAVQFAAEAFEYWGKQAADGRCTPPEWFFFPDHGMWMVKGDRTTLEELANGPEARRLMARGLLLMEGWNWAFADADSGAERFMADYTAALASI